ncbi:hypothetical protein BDV09DRAFT_191588 [Aspergillus tetrazonus]
MLNHTLFAGLSVLRQANPLEGASIVTRINEPQEKAIKETDDGHEDDTAASARTNTENRLYDRGDAHAGDDKPTYTYTSPREQIELDARAQLRHPQDQEREKVNIFLILLQRHFRKTLVPRRHHRKNVPKKEITPGARWTKIDRRLVNVAALKSGGKRFVELHGHLIVLRFLTKDEIQAYAVKTEEIRVTRNRDIRRGRRSGQHSSDARPEAGYGAYYDDSDAALESN